MSEHWHPIRVYDVGATAPAPGTTRQQIVSWLENTAPDKINAAGENYVEAAKLIRDDGGIQDAIMRAAGSLANVWRGEGATTALKALRLLHASAGALADAMDATGKPMTDYAREVTSTRDKVKSAPNGSLLNQNGGVGGTNGGDYSPPLITGGGNPANGTYLITPALADAQARQDLENLNVRIADLNSRISEGLAFQMPDIQPLDVQLDKQDKLDPGSGTRTPTGRDTYWNGGGDGGPGGPGGGDTGGGTDGRVDPTTPQDQAGDGTDPSQGQQGDDPATDPQNDPATPQQPGAGDQPPGQDSTSTDGQDQQRDVPPVIGADNTQTQLADAGNQATTTPGNNSYTNPTNPTVYPTTQNPVTATPNPFAPNQPGGGNTWYGTGGTGPVASPAVLRGGAGAPGGGGFMGYPPGAGIGAAGNQEEEHTREIYDPDPSPWSVNHETGPGKIG